MTRYGRGSRVIPIARYKRWLVAKDLATEAELTAIDAETQAAVDESIEFARQGTAHSAPRLVCSTPTPGVRLPQPSSTIGKVS